MGTAAKTEILIAGAGAVGLLAGLSVARLGRRAIIVGRIETRRLARTVALFDGSIRLLQALDLWPRLAPHAAPLARMCIIDDTGSLFRTGPAFFEASEIGLDQFGWNLENADLIGELVREVQAHPNLTLIDGLLADVSFADDHVAATSEEGHAFEAQLLVAADGRHSLGRKAAQIDVREWTYPQIALTALLAHRRPHQNTSTEFHTRHGPFTLVPLPPKDGQNRSSLVWMMTPEEAERRKALTDADLANEIERQAQSMLGKITLLVGRGIFPMQGMTPDRFADHRILLMGEAAHVFPPIGAQGLNLGLRDIAHLSEIIEENISTDIGDATPTKAYDERRRNDVATRSWGIDLLNRSLLAPYLPVDFMRGAGLVGLSLLKPLRHFTMREGVTPQFGAPRIMRAARTRS
ncbi:UbiH/UbiF family hydroxylase [Methylovirgula sp. 4M-Z18]|uniref:UbiH/UbiF family hydroxylase n=1 Tax=Methylovirgula sp. 4M-Z18 TaxID=2293567 RepID=UPI000E2E989D|nr:UbiH/UbiF family hydroxylase [Methylovirgula sp. 4M-Z18]RFB80597.1 UbiH/UbiF family hydroxylase [Methylovirgula sp. 4M-Z18]